jgi:hypothetical protein
MSSDQELLDLYLHNKICYTNLVKDPKLTKQLFELMMMLDVSIVDKVELLVAVVKEVVGKEDSVDKRITYPLFWDRALLSKNRNDARQFWHDVDLCEELIYSELFVGDKDEDFIKGCLYNDILFTGLIYFPQSLYTINSINYFRKQCRSNYRFSAIEFLSNCNNVSLEFLNRILPCHVYISNYRVYNKFIANNKNFAYSLEPTITGVLLEPIDVFLECTTKDSIHSYDKARIWLEFFKLRKDLTLEMCEKYPVALIFYNVNKLKTHEECRKFLDINAKIPNTSFLIYKYVYQLYITEDTIKRVNFPFEYFTPFILFNINVSDEFIDSIHTPLFYPICGSRFTRNPEYTYRLHHTNFMIILPVSKLRYEKYVKFTNGIFPIVYYTVVHFDIKKFMEYEYSIESKYWKPLLYNDIQGFYLLNPEEI